MALYQPGIKGIKGVSDAFFILGSLLEKIVADPFD